MTQAPITRRSAAFWRVTWALFAAGMAVFALIYSVQPLLPMLSDDFHVGPTASALTLSLTTLTLAVAMLVVSAAADRFGRREIMIASLISSATLGAASALSPGFAALLVVRALMGLTLAGLPSVAIAYLADEMAPGALGLAMGLYIGGTAIGGMTGRLLAAWIAEQAGWRAALGAIGLEALVCGALLWRLLPHAPPRQGLAGEAAMSWRMWGAPLADPVLRRLFAVGFVAMAAFVTIYNYTGYRLTAPPYRLSQSHVGLIFSVYLVGVASSVAAGHTASAIGPRRCILACIGLMLAGVATTAAAPLWLVVVGIAAVTAGFFGAHATASAWVGARSSRGRAQASALYLFAYYAGGSLVGALGGMAWARYAWPGVVLLTAVTLLTGAAVTAGLPDRAP